MISYSGVSIATLRDLECIHTAHQQFRGGVHQVVQPTHFTWQYPYLVTLAASTAEFAAKPTYQCTKFHPENRLRFRPFRLTVWFSFTRIQ